MDQLLYYFIPFFSFDVRIFGLFLYWILKLLETDLQPREDILFTYLFIYNNWTDL